MVFNWKRDWWWRRRRRRRRRRLLLLLWRDDDEVMFIHFSLGGVGVKFNVPFRAPDGTSCMRHLLQVNECMMPYDQQASPWQTKKHREWRTMMTVRWRQLQWFIWSKNNMWLCTNKKHFTLLRWNLQVSSWPEAIIWVWWQWFFSAICRI